MRQGLDAEEVVGPGRGLEALDGELLLALTPRRALEREHARADEGGEERSSLDRIVLIRGGSSLRSARAASPRDRAPSAVASAARLPGARPSSASAADAAAAAHRLETTWDRAGAPAAGWSSPRRRRPRRCSAERRRRRRAVPHWHDRAVLVEVHVCGDGQPLPPVPRQPASQACVGSGRTPGPSAASPQSASVAHPQVSLARQAAPLPAALQFCVCFEVHSTQWFVVSHTWPPAQSGSFRHCDAPVRLRRWCRTPGSAPRSRRCCCRARSCTCPPSRPAAVQYLPVAQLSTPPSTTAAARRADAGAHGRGVAVAVGVAVRVALRSRRSPRP